MTSSTANKNSFIKLPLKSGGNAQGRFGTFGGVFTPCVLTILGVIMFMRTGFVVGEAGLWMSLAILGLSKMITTLTTFSLSAVATNLDMRVGGVYFMISRVLGPDFGGSIGITLFVAQAVSVAFYTIGFTEALFSILTPLFGEETGQFLLTIQLPQIISTVVVALLFLLTFKGADVAIKAQYAVLVILLASVASFLIGGALKFDPSVLEDNKTSAFSQGMSFWAAFAIFFPAATGITAGANMSGDLKNPGKSIPWGTIGAIFFSAAVYISQLFLTAGATPRAVLKEGAFEALKEMSIFSPLIILGVFAATLSSALGSFLGAPRILQAMGQDRLMKIMSFFGKGAGPANEPKRATVLTFAIAVGVIWAGDLNAVAEIISMFFLIAYGMINLSAFVESKSANPSFRPNFKFFHWSTGLAGAIGCTIAMVKINETYALAAVAIAGAIYFYLRGQDIEADFADAKRGFIFQRTRDNLLALERSKSHAKNWRPILVAVTENPVADIQLLRVGAWLESRRGLYTVAEIAERPGSSLADKIHHNRSEVSEMRNMLESNNIIAFSEAVTVDDYRSGLSTFLQSYSIGGLRPNTVLTAMPGPGREDEKERFLTTMEILAAFNLNLVVLKPGDIALSKKRRTIDLWWRGENNGSLMALFAYLIRQDKNWGNANLRVLRIVRTQSDEQLAKRHLTALVEQIRIGATVEVIRSEASPPDVIRATSAPVADLVLLGMAAGGGDEVRRFLTQSEPLLGTLPTTVLVWSNGEADVFA